jgi:TRAP-type uncharacterized transport system substrate-binding protein
MASIAVSAAIVGLASASPLAAQPVNLTIGSFGQGSGWYVYAVNLAEVLRGVLPKGSRIDTPPIAGGVGNPRLVAEGKAEMAFGMAVVGDWALNGKISYDKAMPQLRGLVGGWDQYFLSPIAQGANLGPGLDSFLAKDRPKARVLMLSRGAIGARGGLQLLDQSGMSEEMLKKNGGTFEFGSFDMFKTRFSSRTGDLLIHTVNPGHPAITEIAQNNPVTFLQPSDKALKEMEKKFGWSTVTMPKGMFPKQDRDIRLPGTHTILFGSTKMSDDLAYTVVKAVCEQTDKLRAAHKGLAKFDCANKVWEKASLSLPLHPGAEKYYRERGWIK